MAKPFTHYYYRLFVLLGLLASSVASYGQQAVTISGDFRHLSFEQFARQVEATTPYHFYFKPAAVDSVTVNVQVTSRWRRC
jgi:hypothetical protein